VPDQYRREHPEKPEQPTMMLLVPLPQGRSLAKLAMTPYRRVISMDITRSRRPKGISDHKTR
jgi:hypothetical protein